METIYWIQRIGTIYSVGEVVLVFAAIAMLVSFVIFMQNLDTEECFRDEEKIVTERKRQVGIMGMKMSLLSIVTCLIVVVFVPSGRDLYAIYGIGGTIDYIKKNETAKQLPDKVIDALDAWIDSKKNE